MIWDPDDDNDDNDDSHSCLLSYPLHHEEEKDIIMAASYDGGEGDNGNGNTARIRPLSEATDPSSADVAATLCVLSAAAVAAATAAHEVEAEEDKEGLGTNSQNSRAVLATSVIRIQAKMYDTAKWIIDTSNAANNSGTNSSTIAMTDDDEDELRTMMFDLWGSKNKNKGKIYPTYWHCWNRSS